VTIDQRVTQRVGSQKMCDMCEHRRSDHFFVKRQDGATVAFGNPQVVGLD
jgi:hypothetical protein